MTGWSFYLNVWQLLSIFAYTLAFALFETVTILTLLVIFAVLLPANLYRREFVPISTVFVLLSVLWAIVAQYNDATLRALPIRVIVLLLVAYTASAGIAYYLVQRSTRLREAAAALANRFSILLYLYLPASVISIAIVIYRNF